MILKTLSASVISTAILGLALFATSFASLPRFDTAPDIFHHWPQLRSLAAADDADASPDIFHHWPYLVAVIAAANESPSPDIIHRWPHIA